MEKHIGKIKSASFGTGGYQDENRTLKSWRVLTEVV